MWPWPRPAWQDREDPQLSRLSLITQTKLPHSQQLHFMASLPADGSGAECKIVTIHQTSGGEGESQSLARTWQRYLLSVLGEVLARASSQSTGEYKRSPRPHRLIISSTLSGPVYLSNRIVFDVGVERHSDQTNAYKISPAPLWWPWLSAN